MDTPYTNLPPRAFWRRAVSDMSALELEDVYVPKFTLDRSIRIATAGSCFAQHISRQFRQRGYGFVDMEPAPDLLAPDRHEAFGYGLYSARYGNVYSARQLVQLFRRASGEFQPRDTVWEMGGAFFDPFRPAIQPGGFASAQELERDVAYHLKRVNALLAQTDLFVFTFGLTEAWIDQRDGAALPTCPGTVAGRFDSGKYAFRNFGFAEVLADAQAFITLAQKVNPDIRFLLTVSPVPLTATAGGDHVLPATVYSKSVLRAVCGELAQAYACVDYFPSYELVSSHPMRAMFYEPNLRGVSAVGVGHVMNTFFRAFGDQETVSVTETGPTAPVTDREEICEEQILEIYGQ